MQLFNDISYSTESKLIKRNWIKVDDLSGGQYSAKQNVPFRTFTLRSDLSGYRMHMLLLKGVINDRVVANTNINQKDPAFKNNTF